MSDVPIHRGFSLYMTLKRKKKQFQRDQTVPKLFENEVFFFF